MDDGDRKAIKGYQVAPANRNRRDGKPWAVFSMGWLGVIERKFRTRAQAERFAAERRAKPGAGGTDGGK